MGSQSSFDLANEISSKNAFHVSKILDQSISELKMNYVMSKEKEETQEEKLAEDSKKTDEKEK